MELYGNAFIGSIIAMILILVNNEYQHTKKRVKDLGVAVDRLARKTLNGSDYHDFEVHNREVLKID